MANLTDLLKQIDAEKEIWLLLFVPYVGDYMLFIESLANFEDKESIKRVGRIFWKILETATPIFPEEKIKLIVQRLYEIGDGNLANDICNTYGRRGRYFLKPVWEEHHKK